MWGPTTGLSQQDNCTAFRSFTGDVVPCFSMNSRRSRGFAARGRGSSGSAGDMRRAAPRATGAAARSKGRARSGPGPAADSRRARERGALGPGRSEAEAPARGPAANRAAPAPGKRATAPHGVAAPERAPADCANSPILNAQGLPTPVGPKQAGDGAQARQVGPALLPQRAPLRIRLGRAGPRHLRPPAPDLPVAAAGIHEHRVADQQLTQLRHTHGVRSDS